MHDVEKWEGNEASVTGLLFVAWVLFNGRMTLEIVVIGAIISIALTFAMRRIGIISPRRGLFHLNSLSGAFLYLLCLLWQVLVSNLGVIRCIYTKRASNDKPCLTTYESQLHELKSRMVLANSITLTPGTITVGMDSKGRICVYALGQEFAKGLEQSGFAKRLKRMEEKRHG